MDRSNGLRSDMESAVTACAHLAELGKEKAELNFSLATGPAHSESRRSDNREFVGGKTPPMIYGFFQEKLIEMSKIYSCRTALPIGWRLFVAASDITLFVVPDLKARIFS